MLPLQLNRPRARLSQRGFSMIEVLVTLLIIALALLGTAGLQAYSMRLNQGGQFRSQAVFLVADLAERMEANKTGATAGTNYAANWDYATSGAYDTSVVNTACAVGQCAPDVLATFDKSQWQNAVAATLPQASWIVCVDADGDGVCDVGPVLSDPIAYTITISWVDRRTETTDKTFVAAGTTQQKLESTGAIDAAGTGERFFYKATRTVSKAANNY